MCYRYVPVLATSWASQKTDNVSESPTRRHRFCELRRTWKMEALTLTQQCTREKIDLAEISAKTQSTNFSTINSYKNRRPWSTWNLVEPMRKTKKTLIQVSLLKSPPIKRHYQNSIIYKSSEYDKKWKKNLGKTAFLRCPAQYGFRSESSWTACAKKLKNKLKAGFFFLFKTS